MMLRWLALLILLIFFEYFDLHIKTFFMCEMLSLLFG